MAIFVQYMIILGVDPGSQITGFGVIAVENRLCHYITSGCIRITDLEPQNRLKQIFDSLVEIIQATHPDTAAIEQIFMFQNPGAALKLGQARGVALLALAKNDLPVSEYSARQIKKAIAGTGTARKHQVQSMVMHMLALNKKPQTDAADALAIALCHYHTRETLSHIIDAQKIVHGRLRGSRRKSG